MSVLRRQLVLLATFQRLGFDEIRHVTWVGLSASILSRHTILVLLARHHLLVREFRFLTAATTAKRTKNINVNC